jgi:hypothetical protein
MSEQKFCKRCHNPIEQKRDDKLFCSDKCAAAWAREQGYYREHFHAEKPEWIKKNCEWCNTIFEYNEYAMRGGQRVPKFCSNSCRQSAYRARKAAAGEHAGYTGNWDDARQDKTETKGTSQGKKRTKKERVNDDGQPEHDDNYKGKGTSQENASNGEKVDWDDIGRQWRAENKKRADEREKVRNEKQTKGTSQDTADKGTQQPHEKRWHSKDAYEILGVTYLSTYAQIKAAWKKLLRTYHPDMNPAPESTFISQRINWAWTKIEQSHPKK